MTTIFAQDLETIQDTKSFAKKENLKGLVKSIKLYKVEKDSIYHYICDELYNGKDDYYKIMAKIDSIFMYIVDNDTIKSFYSSFPEPLLVTKKIKQEIELSRTGNLLYECTHYYNSDTCYKEYEKNPMTEILDHKRLHTSEMEKLKLYVN